MKNSMKQPSKSISNSKAALTVGLVCDTSLDASDGVQQYVITLGEWLRGQGHDVHYLTSSTARTDLPNLHVLSRNIEGRFNGNRLTSPLPASPFTIRDLLRDIKFDVLHIQAPYSPLLAGQVIRAAKPNTAVVGTFHIFPESRLVAVATRSLGLLVSAQLKRFDTMMSVSKAAQDFARESHGIGTKVIPNMIDVARFTPATTKKPGKTVQIVFLGRLVERKGCMHLLHAIAEVEATGLGLDYHVRIGGKGPLRGDLEAYVTSAGLGNRVQFDGFVPEEDKVDYLAAADIAVFPSTGGESFGISLLEGMAASPGVVIAGDNPGYRSVMGSRTSQIINSRDTDNFAHALVRFIAKPEDRRKAHEWQRKHVQTFDVHRVGAQIIEEYEAALRLRRE